MSSNRPRMSSARPARRSRTSATSRPWASTVQIGPWRAILVPGGLRSAAHAATGNRLAPEPSAAGVDDYGTGRARSAESGGDLAMSAGRHMHLEQVQPQRARNGVERRSRPGIDLQNSHRVTVHQRIDAAQADQAEMLGQADGRRFQTAPRPHRQHGRRRDTGEPEPPFRQRRAPLLAVAKDPRRPACPRPSAPTPAARGHGAANTSRDRWEPGRSPCAHVRRPHAPTRLHNQPRLSAAVAGGPPDGRCPAQPRQRRVPVGP